MIELGESAIFKSLTPISFGTCSTTVPEFEANNTVRIGNYNKLDPWDQWEYNCGFTRSETENDVIFENEIVFVERKDVQPNPYGILTAKNFNLEMFTQKVKCTFNKWMLVSEFVNCTERGDTYIPEQDQSCKQNGIRAVNKLTQL